MNTRDVKRKLAAILSADMDVAAARRVMIGS